jgi:hypothetical protein
VPVQSPDLAALFSELAHLGGYDAFLADVSTLSTLSTLGTLSTQGLRRRTADDADKLR